MSALEESPARARVTYGFVLVLFLVLMALAHAAAELGAATGAGGDHTVVYHRVIVTIRATLILLTPGSETNHHGVDYCLTEEFAAVYRLHPLLPKAVQVLSHSFEQLTDDPELARTLREVYGHPDKVDLMVSSTRRSRRTGSGSATPRSGCSS
jgi:hypothetical protein